MKVVAERSRSPHPGVAPCSCPPARPPLPRNPPRAAAMVPVCAGSTACRELESRQPGTVGGRCRSICAQKTTSPRVRRAGRGRPALLAEREGPSRGLGPWLAGAGRG